LVHELKARVIDGHSFFAKGDNGLVEEIEPIYFVTFASGIRDEMKEIGCVVDSLLDPLRGNCMF
jgi:hypothetical protein